MKTFPVDDDVVALVWECARPEPFEQLSFSEALRRILKGKQQDAATQDEQLHRAKAQVQTAVKMPPEVEAFPTSRCKPRGRAPKADLRELVRLGILKEGQELVFVDYKGHPQPKHRAAVFGSDLVYQRERYSMSALSSFLLKQEGYIADSVRGPEHWATVDGNRIRELWENVLKQRGEK